MQDKNLFELNANFTQIPNVIFDKIQPIVSAVDFSIIIHIARKTYGYRVGEQKQVKDFDRISLSQFEKGTGLARSTIVLSLQRLEAKGLVLKYSGPINTYGINKEWTPTEIQSPVEEVVRESDQGSPGIGPEVVRESDIQNKTFKQNNKTNILVPASQAPKKEIQISEKLPAKTKEKKSYGSLHSFLWKEVFEKYEMATSNRHFAPGGKELKCLSQLAEKLYREYDTDEERQAGAYESARIFYKYVCKRPVQNKSGYGYTDVEFSPSKMLSWLDKARTIYENEKEQEAKEAEKIMRHKASLLGSDVRKELTAKEIAEGRADEIAKFGKVIFEGYMTAEEKKKKKEDTEKTLNELDDLMKGIKKHENK